MTDARRPWWRRRPALAAVLGVLAIFLLVALVLGGRALLVLFSIGPREEYWQEQAQRPGDIVYVAMGDSLSQGIGSSRPETSFVSVLADDLAERTGQQVRVVNLSVTGAKTDELVADQLPTFVALLEDLDAAGTPVELVTVSIGSNDAGSTSPEQYREDLSTVLEALPPGSYVTDIPDFNGGPRLQAAARLSEVAREEIAARPDLNLVPLEAYTAEISLSEYAADYFHPSDAGYERYIAAFRDAVGTR